MCIYLCMCVHDNSVIVLFDIASFSSCRHTTAVASKYEISVELLQQHVSCIGLVFPQHHHDVDQRKRFGRIEHRNRRIDLVIVYRYRIKAVLVEGILSKSSIFSRMIVFRAIFKYSHFFPFFFFFEILEC